MSRSATPGLVAEALARCAGVEVFEANVGGPAGEWAWKLADELGSFLGRNEHVDADARRAADAAMRLLPSSAAPGVLAVVAPDQVVPAAAARDLERACKALVRRQLAGFCHRVLSRWRADSRPVWLVDDNVA